MELLSNTEKVWMVSSFVCMSPFYFGFRSAFLLGKLTSTITQLSLWMRSLTEAGDLTWVPEPGRRARCWCSSVMLMFISQLSSSTVVAWMLSLVCSLWKEGDLCYIESFKNFGVCLLTLTWPRHITYAWFSVELHWCSYTDWASAPHFHPKLWNLLTIFL